MDVHVRAPIDLVLNLLNDRRIHFEPDAVHNMMRRTLAVRWRWCNDLARTA